ncbi:MAG: tyrosine-type recombinase/integrase [Bradyrhizobium sp.]|nr:tyrosine-type recombinase/integrase [Bradyrhizobium sp.]
MLEELFPASRHLEARHAGASFALERTRYLKHLKDQGYAGKTLLERTRGLLRVVRWLKIDEAGPVTMSQIEVAADRAGYLDGRSGRSRYRFIETARLWLRFCGRIVEPIQERPPFGELIDDFASWMANERGLSTSIIKHRSRGLATFFRWWRSQGRPFRDVRIADIDDYLILAAGRWSRHTMATEASDLRAFFRHAGRCGWCSPTIVEVIEAPHIYEHERLPASLTWDQVQELLASIPICDPGDFRDRATFLLLAVYGLRASEVATIRLEDLDWEQDQIRIRRPKCRDAKVCPLAPTVGNAIVEYLKRGRPRSARPELFLDLLAPFGPMSPRALGQAVKRRMDKLGLPLARKGAHCLRHACAMRLLDEGFSIKEIGDHLGQLSPKSTEIYAKVDLKRLRLIGDLDIGGLL